jgi:hypothetical protein
MGCTSPSPLWSLKHGCTEKLGRRLSPCRMMLPTTRMIRCGRVFSSVEPFVLAVYSGLGPYHQISRPAVVNMILYRNRTGFPWHWAGPMPRL